MQAAKHSGVHEKGELSLSDLLKKVRSNSGFHKVGALGIFVGVVRGETPRGEKVRKLELEAYQEKADEVLGNICKELRKKAGVIDVQVHHFLGEFDVGDDLVYVVVAGVHRHNVFPVLEEAVERYKREAPIFKKEHAINEKGEKRSYWISEHESNS
jgi:molybdopterin synthase catalytic subunit